MRGKIFLRKKKKRYKKCHSFWSWYHHNVNHYHLNEYCHFPSVRLSVMIATTAQNVNSLVILPFFWAHAKRVSEHFFSKFLSNIITNPSRFAKHNPLALVSTDDYSREVLSILIRLNIQVKVVKGKVTFQLDADPFIEQWKNPQNILADETNA